MQRWKQKFFSRKEPQPGAGFVDNNIGDYAVIDPDGFHILAADIKDKCGIFGYTCPQPGVGNGFPTTWHSVLKAFEKSYLSVVRGSELAV